MTSHLHIVSSFLPVYFGGFAFALLTAGRIFRNIRLKKVSYWLFFLTTLVTTFTCGFGGASIRKAEAAPGVDPFVLKTHAWTAMIVFLLSVAMFYFSYKANRDGERKLNYDKKLQIVSLAFLIVFVLTTLIAFRIK